VRPKSSADDSAEPDELLRRADLALYDTKSMGRWERASWRATHSLDLSRSPVGHSAVTGHRVNVSSSFGTGRPQGTWPPAW